MDIIRRNILICRSDELAAGQSKTFPFGGSLGIAYNHDGRIVAYVNRCTHMGGQVSQCAPERFRCHQHQAEFDARTGERISGQAPPGSFLRPIDVVVEDGSVYALLEIVDDFG
jgi:nitrite reductase/ring-hydroxylating ferredoxin subunit